MRTARQQPILAILIYNKSLLVGKIIRNLYTVLDKGKLYVAMRIAPPADDAAEQDQLIIKLIISVYKPNIKQIKYSLVDADVASPLKWGSAADFCIMICAVWFICENGSILPEWS